MQDWVKAEFVNWSRWCWQGPHPGPAVQTRAASAEGRYVPVGKSAAEDRQDEEADKKEAEPNRAHAERVERVYRTLLTDMERRIVAAEFPRRHLSGRATGGRSEAAQRLRVSLSVYDKAIEYAASRVELEFSH